MKHPSEFAIDQEHAALDQIHAVLSKAPKSGLKAREIAHESGLSIGRVQEILRRSECVLRRLKGTMRWIADWTEVPVEYRPATRCARVARQPHKLDGLGSIPGTATNLRVKPAQPKVTVSSSISPKSRGTKAPA